ncbi:MAG: hypothetical protein ACI936_003308 [Paraglaciecola sp.]|jgi:hypothetical protein
MSNLFVTLLTEITLNMLTATVTLLIPILAAAMNASFRFIYLRHKHRNFSLLNLLFKRWAEKD